MVSFHMLHILYSCVEVISTFSIGANMNQNATKSKILSEINKDCCHFESKFHNVGHLFHSCFMNSLSMLPELLLWFEGCPRISAVKCSY